MDHGQFSAQTGLESAKSSGAQMSSILCKICKSKGAASGPMPLASCLNLAHLVRFYQYLLTVR